ncbi:undecaprenyl/decaprenyl-phosphate alpha-N-acetylglucosaminyl 1-phosphate transferase, partial [Patescibacteria group bacterium]|nr:undecaprenyl/decaprenyl-phosphate alpha-N-acetylglucosaminyl 1-phosphate transferase [Patescibacteria group bacterium]
MFQQYFIPALFAFILTFALSLAARKFFPKWGLMDRPEKYGLKRKPIPYYGGLLIYIGFVLTVLLFVPMDLHIGVFLIAATLIAGVSFIDDLIGLSPVLRLFVQVVAALMLVFAGIGILSISNPLGAPIVLDSWKLFFTLDHVYEFSVLSALFTVVWVVAIVNTMNFLDGLNGLPSGIAVIAGVSLFLLSVRPGMHFDASSQVPVAMMSLILASTALAFWFFDFYPAKMLMGDTGSMFLGFVLATMAIFSGGKVTTAFLVMGFPILDAIWVILRRILQGKSPMKGDLKHLHHRLLDSGLSQRGALYIIYAVSIIFGAIAVFL